MTPEQDRLPHAHLVNPQWARPNAARGTSICHAVDRVAETLRQYPGLSVGYYLLGELGAELLSPRFAWQGWAITTEDDRGRPIGMSDTLHREALLVARRMPDAPDEPADEREVTDLLRTPRHRPYGSYSHGGAPNLVRTPGLAEAIAFYIQFVNPEGDDA